MSRNHKESWRDRARSIRQTARRLGAKPMREFEPGDWAYTVQCHESVGWRFASLEAATEMAECLVRMDRAPGTRHSYTRRSGRIDCFELLILPEDIGPVPTRLLVWSRDAGDWTETWSGNAAGAGAAIEKRKRSTPTTAPTM